ncbi:MAG: hypothetical protein H7647_09650 [Candidatus Heimdallarchaeota archaeon]|nr:hypothetical protein [Candidatus Heimdallarchaeota archaeon]MCK4254692.1 hypothetical protein [Candidatus Heimdallarchaeota archaeon]
MNNGGITSFFSGDKKFEIIESMLCVGDYQQALSLTGAKLDEAEFSQIVDEIFEQKSIF